MAELGHDSLPSQCSAGATGSCLKAAITPWNVSDQKAKELTTRLPSQGLGMPDCPRGSCSLTEAQVQGWAVGGGKAQGPADGHGRGREDASGSTTFIYELLQSDALSDDTKKSRVFSKLIVS